MKKVSVTKWSKERDEWRELIDEVHGALDMLNDSTHLDSHELRLLAEAKSYVFCVLDSWGRKGDILRDDYFRSMQDGLQPGDEGYGQDA